MPTYEYECDNCKHSFEHFQMMTDKVLRKCPECGKFKLHRLIGSGAGIIFKGSGFYETDYKRSSESTSNQEKAEKSASSEETASSKPKPESSTETKTSGENNP